MVIGVLGDPFVPLKSPGAMAAASLRWPRWPVAVPVRADHERISKNCPANHAWSRLGVTTTSTNQHRLRLATSSRIVSLRLGVYRVRPRVAWVKNEITTSLYHGHQAQGQQMRIFSLS